MNNYVVAKNAVITFVLSLLFILSLQPQKISSALMDVSSTISAKLASNQQVEAAQNNLPTADEQKTTIKLDSYTLSIPILKDFKSKINKDAAILSGPENKSIVITIESYDGDITQKAVLLSNYLTENSIDTNISIHPVLRDDTLFYEIRNSNSKVYYAIHRVSDRALLTIAPNKEVNSNELDMLLTKLEVRR